MAPTGPTTAVLGTGIMGSGMARSLLRAGHAVRVWNRTFDKAAELERDGAVAVETPAAAVKGADVVVTILADGDVTSAVMEEALPSVADDGLWIQSGTVGIDATERLAERAAGHGLAFVDAPVSGTRQPAERGELLVLASGPAVLRDRAAPVLDAIGQKTIWVSERTGDGTRLKLVMNNWLLGLLAALGESIALAEALGLGPAAFLAAIEGGPLGPAYAQLKGNMMVAGDYPTAFPLALAAKDAGLVLDAAAETGLHLAVAEAAKHWLDEAAGSGHSDADMAAVIEAIRPD